MRKLFALLLTFAILTALAACGSGTTDTGNGSREASADTVAGQTITSGKIKMICPEGWNQMPSDALALPDNSVAVYKGESNEAKPLKRGNIRADFDPKKERQYTEEDYKLAYTSVTELTPFTLGGKTFSGFVGVMEDFEQANLFVYTDAGNYFVRVSLNDGLKLTDPDVQAALASITGTK